MDRPSASHPEWNVLKVWPDGKLRCQNCEAEQPKSNPGDKVAVCPECGFTLPIIEVDDR
jgi:rRNA maturation endonuclease Nob1